MIPYTESNKLKTMIKINWILHRLRILAKKKTKSKVIVHMFKMYNILREIKTFQPNEKINILKNGSIQYQLQKQKFSHLPPRHLLPGEIQNFSGNYLIREKADGILINQLPLGIFPNHDIINYQIKAEYIEDLDLYLIFDIDIPNTTIIDRYNFLRNAHCYTKNSSLKKINNFSEFIEMFDNERETLKIFLNENKNHTLKWYPKFGCLVNNVCINHELIKNIILENNICKKLNYSEPYNCDGLILSPIDGSREIKVKPLSMMTIDIMFNNKWVDRENNDLSNMIISDIKPKEGKIYRCNPILSKDKIKFRVDSYRYDKKKPNPGLIISSICNILKYDWTLDLCSNITCQQNYYYDKPKKLISKSLISMINQQRDAIFEQISILDPHINSNWLDLGCGKGKIINTIKKYNPKSYLGLDIDISCLVKCLKYHDEEQDVYLFNKCDLGNKWEETDGVWFNVNNIKYDYVIANFSLMHFFTDLFWNQLDQVVSVGTKFIFNLVSLTNLEWSESDSFLKIDNNQVIYKFEWIHDTIKTEPFISEEIVFRQLEKSNWKVISKKIGNSKHGLSRFYTWWVIEKI